MLQGNWGAFIAITFYIKIIKALQYKILYLKISYILDQGFGEEILTRLIIVTCRAVLKLLRL